MSLSERRIEYATDNYDYRSDNIKNILKKMTEGYFGFNRTRADIKIDELRLRNACDENDSLMIFFRATMKMRILAAFDRLTDIIREEQHEKPEDPDAVSPNTLFDSEPYEMHYDHSINMETHRFNVMTFPRGTSDEEIALKILDDIEYEMYEYISHYLEKIGFRDFISDYDD